MRPDRRSTAGIAIAFAASTLASLGLTVVYVTGGQPQLEGALLGVALGGIAIGAILWAKRGLPVGGVVQERPVLPSSEESRHETERRFEEGAELLERRRLLLRLLVAAAGALGLAALFPIRSLGRAPGDRLFSTAWRRGARAVTAEGVPVLASDLVPGSILTVFPEGHAGSADSQTLLIGLEAGTVADAVPAGDGSAWLIAFSKVCTHAGCPVGLYRPDRHLLFCPCHQSEFEVSAEARPVQGPAARPLPRLPIEIDGEGHVVATGDFPEPIGPGFWERPRG
ncbi:MAG TPA: Rieske 2Fe-2S domain-containing protein [Actinomycetota bacterium]|nr:Rieske 2Fe-2S domain-containing protein [Actinomycetota bacterium]